MNKNYELGYKAFFLAVSKKPLPHCNKIITCLKKLEVKREEREFWVAIELGMSSSWTVQLSKFFSNKNSVPAAARIDLVSGDWRDMALLCVFIWNTFNTCPFVFIHPPLIKDYIFFSSCRLIFFFLKRFWIDAEGVLTLQMWRFVCENK